MALKIGFPLKTCVEIFHNISSIQYHKEKNMENKTIKIFLASSNELSDDREKFGNFVRSLDNIFEAYGLRIKVFMWEDYIAAWKGDRKQKESNANARSSDYF